MKLTNLDPTKYKRFFSFGCSFTNYAWPTWADIISQDIEYFENWGRGGSGNYFIFNQFLEALERNNFSQDDLVMIMWSHPRREDRYVKDKWVHAAGSQRKEVYGKSWEKNFACDRGNLIRDLSFINATIRICETLKCDWDMFYMMPLAHLDVEKIDPKEIEKSSEDEKIAFWYKINKDLHNGIVNDLLENKDVFSLYNKVFQSLNPSIWAELNLAQSDRPFGDQHPTPLEALKYLEVIFPNNKISNDAKDFADRWDRKVREKKIDPNIPYKSYNLNRL